MAIKQRRIKCAACGEREIVTRGERGPVTAYCDMCREERKREQARERVAAKRARDHVVGDQEGVMGARQFIEAGETALVVFTRRGPAPGDLFDYDEHDRTGQTGAWYINPKRPFDRVIIYRRDDHARKNFVYVAIPRAEKIKVGRRHMIELTDVEARGDTPSGWAQFTESKKGYRNPVRYVR